MRYKIIYTDASAPTVGGETTGADLPPPARFPSEVVCWPAGYINEMRASLNLIEGHVELLLHGTPPLIAEHIHAYLRKIQRASDQMRILVQSQTRRSSETSPGDSSSEADHHSAASVCEISASLDAIERDLELLLHGHSVLLSEHFNAFLLNIQNAAARMRVNLQSQSDRPEEGGGEGDVAPRS